MQKYKYSFISMLVMLLAVAYSCANPGFPSGGAKDETPPVIKSSIPELNAKNYKKNNISIEFNENIKLDDVYSKFVTSPPLKKRPTIDARGSKLKIKLDDKEVLQDNTTYTFDFADAIQDNNEGNTIPSFAFSFSTGKVVDSLSISGNLWDAKDLSPVKGVLILAHKNLNDTAFTRSIPERLAKTDKNGFFSLKNLGPGKYRIYALDDTNRDYKFDQPGEQIAWFDTIVSPSTKYIDVVDSISKDSIHQYKKLVSTPNKLKMFLFTEDDGNQYKVGEERKTDKNMSFFFNNPVEKFKVTPIDTVVSPNWDIYEPSANADSVLVWITDSNLYKKDTLKVALNYMGLDSLKKPSLITDTLTMYHFTFEKKKRKKRRGDKVKEVKKESLKIDRAISLVDVNSNFSFTMPTPIKSINKEKLFLYQKIDSTKKIIDFKLSQDSTFKRKYWVKPLTKWIPGGQYTFVVDSLAISDVYDLHTDSISKSFSVKELDSYGLLLLDIANAKENWLIQLQNTSGKTLQQKYVPKSGKLAFQYISPGDYNIKLVIDKNKNGKWDTGDYKLKRHAESVMYYDGKVNVRSNWDVEVKWNPLDFNIYNFVKKYRKAKERKQE